MTERKWTDGPWFIDSLATMCVNGARDGGRGAVCSTGGYFASWRDGEELLAENQANAHLIAAAPDMYEALEVAASILQRALEDPSWRTSDNTFDMCEAIRQARAALAKARGEEQ